MSKDNFENKSIFRLLKVIYIISFIFLSIIITYFSWSNRPINVIDLNKSDITCYGNNYSFNDVGINISISNVLQFDVLDKYNDNIVKELCKKNKLYDIANNQTQQKITVSYSELSKYNIPEPKIDEIVYVPRIVNAIKGGWINSLIIFIFGITSTYILLYISKETLNYIIFGKPFNWKSLFFLNISKQNSNNKLSSAVIFVIIGILILSYAVYYSSLSEQTNKQNLTNSSTNFIENNSTPEPSSSIPPVSGIAKYNKNDYYLNPQTGKYTSNDGQWIFDEKSDSWISNPSYKNNSYQIQPQNIEQQTVQNSGTDTITNIINENKQKCIEDNSEYNSCMSEYNSKLGEYNTCLNEKIYNEYKYCNKPFNFCLKPYCSY